MTKVTVTEAEATVKWFDKTKAFGFFEVEDFGDVFVHATKIGTFRAWEMQEGAPAIISFETGSNGKLQVTKVHMILLGYVKLAGDTFCLPEPVVETSIETPDIPEVVILKLGAQHQGLVASVKPGGFGFLKIEGVGKFLFFHFSALPDSAIKPKVGQVFTYTVGQNDRGLTALEMQLVEVTPVEALTDVDDAPEAEPADETPLRPTVSRRPRKTKDLPADGTETAQIAKVGDLSVAVQKFAAEAGGEIPTGMASALMAAAGGEVDTRH